MNDSEIHVSRICNLCIEKTYESLENRLKSTNLYLFNLVLLFRDDRPESGSNLDFVKEMKPQMNQISD